VCSGRVTCWCIVLLAIAAYGFAPTVFGQPPVESKPSNAPKLAAKASPEVAPLKHAEQHAGTTARVLVWSLSACWQSGEPYGWHARPSGVTVLSTRSGLWWPG